MLPTDERFDATALTRLSRVVALAPSPCGQWVAVEVRRLVTDESKYVSDLWRVPLTGGSPRRLTRTDHDDRRPRFAADGSLAFLSSRPLDDGADAAGNHQRLQLWRLPAEGGEPAPLTDEPLGVSDFRFPRRGDGFVVIASVLPGVPHEQQRARWTERAERGPSALRYRSLPVRFWDHWLPEEAPHVIAYDGHGARRDLTPGADREHRAGWAGVEWDLSPDGDRVVITCMRPARDRIHDIALRVIDTEAGTHHDLGVDDATCYEQPLLSPDGGTLVCVRTHREPGVAERPQLWLFDELRAGATGRPLAADWDRGASPHAFTTDGASVLVTADDRGHVPVFRVGLSGEVARLSSEDAGGSHEQLAVVGSRVVGLRHRLTHPPEPFSMPLATGARPTLLAELSGLSPARGEALAEVESLDVPAADGEVIQTFVVAPRQRRGRLPGLLWIHGGPIAQHADGWHWRWNPLVVADAGYVLTLPNPRGSTGRGHAFVQGIWNNRWGDTCYDDLMAVTDALCERNDVDPRRIAAMGGSFGGYMANWIGGSTDRFGALVTHAGIFSFPAFYGTTDFPGYFAYHMGATPYEDLSAYERFSPHARLDAWTTPTLIIHGEKDYRVPVSEALLLFQALELRGVDAELVIYPDENHWILRPQNTRHWYQSCLAFLARHLPPIAAE